MPSTNEILMEAINATEVPTEMVTTQETIEQSEHQTIIYQESSEIITADSNEDIDNINNQEITVVVESGNEDTIAIHDPSQSATAASVVTTETATVTFSEAAAATTPGSEGIINVQKTQAENIQIVAGNLTATAGSSQPGTSSILQTYILNQNQNRSNGLPVISSVAGSPVRPTVAKTVKVAPKPAVQQQMIPIAVSTNQIAGGTVVSIPQAKGVPPKKIVILPPPTGGGAFSPNSVQRCLIRPQTSGIQVPQLIFIPNTTTSPGVVQQVQNITTVPSAISTSPSVQVMTSCLRPNTAIRSAAPTATRPIRATYSGTKIRAVAPTATATDKLCDKCKNPINAGKGLAKKDTQTQTPSQTFRTNNTAPLISAMQQRCKKYNQAARAFKAKIKRLEGRIESLQKHVKSNGKPVKTIDNIIKASKPYLSETAHDLFRLLLSSDPDKSSTCTRYADCTKDFALSLYCCSKTAYRVCQSVLKLPTPHGLMRKTRNVSDKVGGSSAGASGNMDSNQDDDEDELHEDENELENDEEPDEPEEEMEDEAEVDDGENNEDEQAANEVVELMHCETGAGFEDGQFEIIIPGSHGRT